MCAFDQMVQEYQRVIKAFCQKPNKANLLISNKIILNNGRVCDILDHLMNTQIFNILQPEQKWSPLD